MTGKNDTISLMINRREHMEQWVRAVTSARVLFVSPNSPITWIHIHSTVGGIDITAVTVNDTLVLSSQLSHFLAFSPWQWTHTGEPARFETPPEQNTKICLHSLQEMQKKKKKKKKTAHNSMILNTNNSKLFPQKQFQILRNVFKQFWFWITWRAKHQDNQRQC